MAANWKRFTASVLLVTAIFFCLSAEARTARISRRVVILAPAAADVLERLGAGTDVVGVTNSVDNFPEAVKVGTHLNPGVETIASLRPGLIIATSRFNPELAERMGAALFVYEPKTLEAILADVRLLAAAIGREEQGRALADTLQAVLDGLTVPGERPTVLYETRSNPLAVANADSVVTDLLERAGLRHAYPEGGGALSVEYLMANQPEYYVYQDGPMNRNPVPPSERPGWENFRACSWKVNEFDFARPNTTLFETARILNHIINSEHACAQGAATFHYQTRQ